MKEKGIEIIINFIVRAVLGAAVIFFVNQFLDSQKIPIAVGLNPFTVLTGGILGLPGVALLYAGKFCESFTKIREMKKTGGQNS